MMSAKSLGAITPQKRNANRHTQRGMGALEKSIQADGMIGAITVAANGEIFDGSARREVIETAGLDDAIIVRSDGSRPIIHIREDIPTADDPRAVRLGLAANRVAELNLAWDAELLAEIGAENSALLDGLFSGDELAALLAAIAEPIVPGAGGDEFDTTPEDGPTRTQAGDLWLLGKHRLLVGDCADAANVARLMDGKRADALISDPPYGINWNTDYTRFTSGYNIARRNSKPIANDKTTFDPTPWLDYSLVILFGANYFASSLPVGTWLVWDKRHSNGTALLSDAELAWMSKNKGVYIYSKTWQGIVRDEPIDHPTQKPVSLFEWCFEQAGLGVGIVILDPFLGSGTTLIAAERTGRTCYGMEISETYADVILRRWEAETGQVAQKVDTP